MSAQIDVHLKWSETKPGWIAEAYCKSFRDAAHIRATGDVGGFSPLASIAMAINAIALQINCHPANTEVMIKVDGEDLLVADTRANRL